MRVPIILILLVILLLPADLRGFADDIGTQVQAARATVSKYLERSREDAVQVAEGKVSAIAKSNSGTATPAASNVH